MDKITCYQKISDGDKLRVLFLNDVGFQYGAGIAQFRQVQSFLLFGHQVGMFCWSGASYMANAVLPFGVERRLWLGARSFPELHFHRGCQIEDIINGLVAAVKEFAPDLVVVGNLHGAQWPLQLLAALRELDFLTVAYMHDCYLLSGRCAYPGECLKYLTGCDSDCPTINEYPPLARNEVAAAWQYRRSLFSGSDAIPVATNSQWVLEQARRSFPAFGFAKVVYLGLDCSVYRPIERNLARRLLGLSETEFIILFGAINFEDRRKGGHILRTVSEALKDRVSFLVFGENSKTFKSLKVTGSLVRDFRKMPLLFSAADIYLFTSLEEAFGQTVMEASACGIPVIAFNIGGVGEIAIDKNNALLLNDIDSIAVIELLNEIIDNRQLLDGYGQSGLALVRERFSLEAQWENWKRYLAEVAGNPSTISLDCN